MQEIIKLLKERGFVDDLQHCVNVTTKLSGGKHDEKAQMEASKATLFNYIDKFDEKDELFEKFITFATDMALEAIVKELDLKAQEDCKVSKTEELLFEVTKLVKNLVEDK